MSAPGYFEVRGLRLREEPARDPSFKVVRRESEMNAYEGEGELAQREALHRHMSNEITSLDIAAQCLVEYPDAPWALRMELARQAWDEARHVAVLHRRLREKGGFKGEFPVSAFEWSVTCAIPDLAGRLASQNRTFEAGAMDVVGGLIPLVKAVGDRETARVLEGILADEVQHVRFANRWIKQMVGEDKRVLLRVAMAVRFLAEANVALQAESDPGDAAGEVTGDAAERVPAVNVVDRQRAEFSDEEIHEILRQAGFRSLVPTGSAAGRS